VRINRLAYTGGASSSGERLKGKRPQWLRKREEAGDLAVLGEPVRVEAGEVLRKKWV
jgi:hypothetical protein